MTSPTRHWAAIILSALILLASCARTLAPVQGLTAIPNGATIQLSWQPVASASGYEVFLSTQPSVSPTLYDREIVETGVSTTITDLTVGATYYLVVAPTSLYGFALGPTSDVIGVTITGMPSSPAPVITVLNASPAVANSGDLVLFAVTAADSDADTLTYTWLVNGTTVAGPTADMNQTFWTAGAPGSYTVEVQVSDGTTTVEAVTIVTVQ